MSPRLLLVGFGDRRQKEQIGVFLPALEDCDFDNFRLDGLLADSPYFSQFVLPKRKRFLFLSEEDFNLSGTVYAETLDGRLDSVREARVAVGQHFGGQVVVVE